MILVTGATGNAGGAVLRALIRGGKRVRAFVRTDDAALPQGVDHAVGDLDQPESFARALTGINGVFLLPGYRDMPALLARVRDLGVARVVLLSGGMAEAPDVSNPISQFMIASEDAVRSSGVTWTILRPCAFMSNTLRWIPQLRAGGVVTVPFSDVPSAVIDPDDIGAVVAAVFGADGHDGAVYRISGPEALTPREQVQTLTAVLKRDLLVEPPADLDPVAAALAIDESRVLPTVERITGRRPSTFEQWARRNAEAFR